MASLGTRRVRDAKRMDKELNLSPKERQEEDRARKAERLLNIREVLAKGERREAA